MDRVTTAPAWHFPTGDTTRLDNGLTVKLVDMPGRLIATVAVTIGLPTEVERPHTEGAVAALAALMQADAPHARSGRVSDVAKIGAAITTGCDHRGPKVMADCPVDGLPVLLDALAPMVLRFEPTPRSFEAYRRRVAAERANEAQDPFALANKLLNESVLARGNRYARSISGTAASWQRLCLDDIVELHQAYVDPGRLTVIVVGDLESLDVPAAVERAFGPYPPRGRPLVADRAPAPGGAARLSWRPGRDGAQTQLMLGCFSIDRSDPRWPAARVGAEILGGGPDALLNVELRDRLGISYGVQARFLPFFAGGLFLLSGAVDDARSERAVEVVRDVLRRFVDEGVDAETFRRVRDRMISTAPEVYETSLAVAQQHAELVSCDIGESFVDTHLDRLRALEPAEMVDNFGSIVDPERLHVVVVGRFDPDASVVAELPRA